MKSYKYLIIGASLAGDAAARGIREVDPQGTIGLIGAEPDGPYMRPNLSKGLWKGRPMEKVWRNTQDLPGVEMNLGRKVTSLDTGSKMVRDDQGEEYRYEKLLLATGGTPKHLPFGEDRIIYYRNLEDYRHVRALTEGANDFLVIGGGFIGSEMAAALNMAGKKVVMIFPEQGIGANIFPPELSSFLNDYYREKGVEVVTGDSVASVESKAERSVVTTKNGKTYAVDGIVAGIGIRPNLELAEQAGLKTGDGVVVDDQLRSSNPDIYAAGDVANFFHSLLGKRTRVEHEDNAVKMGKQAGRNMAGAGEGYSHAPMFYSDLFELGYEAVGETDSRLSMVSDWEEPYKKGTVYYLEDGRVRGVLLWNVSKAVPAARALLGQAGPFEAEDLKGKIEEREK
jgi:NADPH-dependent 2,4-dienoyl-CoA reductase/sulfur reductase-like enzyme